MKRTAVGTKALGLVMLLAACGLSTAPQEELGPGEVELGFGDEIQVPETVLRVAFLAIEEDSRCPIGVVCIWEGDAAVRIGLTAGSGPTQLHVLHTAGALEPKSVDFEGLRVSLVRVDPPRREGQTIPEDEYVIRLILEPVEP